MKRKAWTLAALVVAAGAAAVAWPGVVDRALPGAGERFAAVRAALPTSVETLLPVYEPPRPPAQAQAPGAGGAPRREANAPAGGPRGGGPPGAANRPPAPVVLEKAARGPLPVLYAAVGSVQPIATVALKSRVDAQIQEILVADGATVEQGQVLARLDSRQIEAQIKQAEASLARNLAALEQARRDVGRFEELTARQVGTKVNLDNARTQVASVQAAVMGDRAQIENLNVQLTYYTIRAPISGRLGTINVKAGNIIRAGDNNATGTLATIVQTRPIYVAFSVPQRLLPDLRRAVGDDAAVVEATPQGGVTQTRGRIAFIDNQIDAATGTVSVRAEFENAQETLWAGQLCNLRITLRTDPDVVTIPREATQAGQTGSFVYVIENGVARVRPVKIARTQDGRDVVTEGLKGGESVVVEGALALVNGARVEPRAASAKRDS